LKAVGWASFANGIKTASLVAFTGRIKTATTAVKAFGLAMRGATVLGIGFLALGIADVFLNIKIGAEKAKQAQDRMNAAVETYNNIAGKELAALNSLITKLQAAKKDSAEYEKIKREINIQYGGYLTNLGIELNSVDDLTNSYEKLAAAVKKSALGRSMEQYKDVFDRVDTALTNLYGPPVGLGGDNPEKELELYKKNLADFKEKEKEEIINLYDLLAKNKTPEDFGGQGWNSERFKGLMSQLQNSGIITGTVGRFNLDGLRKYIDGMNIIKTLEDEINQTAIEPPSPPPAPDEKATKTSLKWYENEITRINRLLKEAPSMEQAAMYQKEIDLLAKKKKSLETDIKLQANLDKPIKTEPTTGTYDWKKDVKN
jgi:hypothetical protein